MEFFPSFDINIASFTAKKTWYFIIPKIVSATLFPHCLFHLTSCTLQTIQAVHTFIAFIHRQSYVNTYFPSLIYVIKKSEGTYPEMPHTCQTCTATPLGKTCTRLLPPLTCCLTPQGAHVFYLQKKKKKKSLYQINQVWQSIEEIKCNGDEESVWSNVFGLKSEE